MIGHAITQNQKGVQEEGKKQQQKMQEMLQLALSETLIPKKLQKEDLLHIFMPFQLIILISKMKKRC